MPKSAYCGKILVVDDEQSELELASRHIRDFHTLQLEPVCVKSIAGAIELLRDGDFIACLCDYWMPAPYSGLDLVAECLSSGINVPIVISTNGASLAIDEEVMQAGAADFIAKSEFNTDIFERTIRHVLIRHKTMMQLIDDAATDPLTRCLSRLYFQRKVERDFMLAQSQKEPLCALAIDLDKLKYINDQFGHEAGDISLATVCQGIQHILRGHDYIGRMGGDEFIAILPCCDLIHGAEVAQRLIDAVNNIQLHFNRQQYRPSISIGISSNEDSQNLQEMLRKADAALYESKKQGGGHFCYPQDFYLWSDQAINK